MKRIAILALVAAIAAAEDAPKTDAERQLARVEAHVKRARASLDAHNKAKTSTAKLNATDRARFHLERAHGIARARKEPEFAAALAEVKLTLADALVREAAVYYERKSLPRAKETVGDALKLAPDNAKAKALLDAILRAEKEDLFDTVDGVTAIDRVRQRRLETGIPLRDRGLSRRR